MDVFLIALTGNSLQLYSSINSRHESVCNTHRRALVFIPATLPWKTTKFGGATMVFKWRRRSKDHSRLSMPIIRASPLDGSRCADGISPASGLDAWRDALNLGGLCRNRKASWLHGCMARQRGVSVVTGQVLGHAGRRCWVGCSGAWPVVRGRF